MSFAAGHRSGATKTGGVVAPPTRPAQQQSHGFQKPPAQQQQPQPFHNNTTTMTRPQSQHQPQHHQQQQDYSLMFTNFLSDLQQQFQEAVQIANDLRSKELEPIQNEIALVMAQIDQLEKENQSLEEVLQHALEFKQQNGPIPWGSAFLNDHPQQQQQHTQQHHQQHDGNTRHGQYYGNAGLGGGGFDPNNMRETFDDMDQFYPQSQSTQTENTTYRPDDGDMGDGNQPPPPQQQKDQDQLPPLTETKTSKQDSTSQANNKAGDADVAPVAKQSSSSTKTGDKDSKKKDRATK